MRSLDFDKKGNFAFVAEGVVDGHFHPLWSCPLDGSGFESFWEVPFELGWNASDAGVFPVGVPGGVVFDVEANGEWFTGYDGGGGRE